MIMSVKCQDCVEFLKEFDGKIDLAQDLIVSYSNPGNLIFDPFCGSGTTLKQAVLLNRRIIGTDLSQDYVNRANERLSRYLNGDL